MSHSAFPSPKSFVMSVSVFLLRVCKFFRIRSYKKRQSKPFRIRTYKKTGVGGTFALQCAPISRGIVRMTRNRTHRKVMLALARAVFAATSLSAQTKLSTKWEELTAPDFRQGIQQAKGTCLLPFGILEKHGPHLPLGTDLLNVRYASLQAASQEYAMVFPEYYFGQIFEAKHEPGTVAYSMELQLRLLQETADEMARNGCKKIIIVNGHGGNEHLLPFFAQAQLDKPHDYVVYVLVGGRSRPGSPAKKSTGVDYHAGENETSNTMVSRPDLVHLDRAKDESGADTKRQNLPEDLYTESSPRRTRFLRSTSACRHTESSASSSSALSSSFIINLFPMAKS